MNLTHHIRVPAEQYAYLETDFEGTAEEAVQLYRHITDLIKGGAGLPDKDFDQFIQAIIEDEPNQIENLEKLSPDQHHLMQVVKRAMKRIGYHGRKELAEQEEHIKNIK